jgi:hypothetical protein
MMASDPKDLCGALQEIWKIVHTPTKKTGYRFANDHYAADFDAIRKIIKASGVVPMSQAQS